MNCPACDSANTETVWEVSDRLFRTTTERFHIARCLACNLLYLFPTPAELSRYYPQGYWASPAVGQGAAGLRQRLRELYRRVVLADHVRFVRGIAKEQERKGQMVVLLDVGCGDGSFLAACGNHRRVGLDNSASALRAARARGLSVVRSSLLGCPFPDRAFSVITMFHFLEHVSPPAPYLKAARHLLRDDGSLVVQVPNAESWQARLLGRHWSGWDVPRHLVNFSLSTLRAALGGAGFHIVQEKHFSLRDNAAALATSLAPALYPPARDAHGSVDRGPLAWLADVAYLALVVACLPFSLAESLFGHGATVMVEARKTAEAR